MGDEGEPTGRLGGWIKNGQLVLTLLTAAFGLYISVQQHEIKKAQDQLSVDQQQIKNKQDAFALVVTTKAETEKFAERTLAYVEKLSMPAEKQKQKEAILIDLLDAIALANASKEGTTDQQKVLHTPLWIALATGNVEALGLIGNADNRRAVWFDLANGSGDATVRMTAMEALARSSASKPMDHLLEIYELSEDLNNSDILDSAIDQIVRVVRVMERHTDPAQFREDERIKPLIARLEALRTSLSTSAVAPAGDEKSTAERRSALQRQTQGVERALAFLRSSEIAVAVAAVPPPGGPSPVPGPSGDVKSLVEGLESPDTGTRRQSREALANVADPAATVELLAALVNGTPSYRVKLGVASALYQTKRPVVIKDPNQVSAVVALIGDEDVLVRKYASESLMKLTDPETVKSVHDELSRIVQSRAKNPPNAVYNAVAVLGTWLRILPSDLQAERASIKAELTALKSQLYRDPSWSYTYALVDEMLRLSTATRQAGASAGDRP